MNKKYIIKLDSRKDYSDEKKNKRGYKIHLLYTLKCRLNFFINILITHFIKNSLPTVQRSFPAQ